MTCVTQYNQADAAAAVEFFRKVNALDETVSAQTLLEWQQFVDEPENDGGSGFFAIWGNNKRLIALAYSQLEVAPIRHFRIFVHPLHRRQGLARSLLATISKQRPRYALQTYCPERWRATDAFLRMTGLKAVDREEQMKRLPGVGLVDGTLRIHTSRAVPSDFASICGIHELAYRDSVGFVPLYTATLEQRLAKSECELLGDPRILRAGHRICRTQPRQRMGSEFAGDMPHVPAAGTGDHVA